MRRMIDSSRFIEKFLQNYRFKIVMPYLKGDVLDFGGNKGELKRYVKGKYLVVNYDHFLMKKNYFDTIVALAVIEHIDFNEVFDIFKKFKKIMNKNGRVLVTTPTVFAKPVLEFWSFLGIVDSNNIIEHKHYWNKRELFSLANETGLKVVKYRIFQFGFNQLTVFAHK